ncbi:glycosyltransferase [Pectinatus brassicae]|uniref:Dolichol-phosphate mannosyltransferase n=1 Tax=Pectinatus brassicae TaxID=862415 RepID=A0A840UKW4_9FIRM|nr:glycosyltransferase [Pectinatus brassicae]MBB5336810.1 dolichol-phosphate mannosyltransferase [Pectinatus brassicae]
MDINKEKNFLSVVAYIHNDENDIAKFIENINEILSNNFNKYEIILVDDASNDISVAIIKEAVQKIKSCTVQIIHMSYYHGNELAMNAGVQLAIGDFVFEFDKVSIDYDDKYIMDTYRRSLTGYDIVSVSPAEAKSKGSQLFYKLYNKFSNNQYELKTECFRILSRRAINRIFSMSKTIPYRKALYANCGLKQDTLYYKTKSQTIEKDSQEKHYRYKMAVDALILFTDIGYKTAFILTLVMMAISIIIAAYTAFIFIAEKPVSGWTSMMIFMAVGFTGIFAVSAIIIKYLDLLVGLVFKKKTSTIESIEKLTH